MLACRLLDLTESNGAPIDLVLGLKFPAYLVSHPRKVLWLVHQHRAAYELWDHSEAGYLARFPNGDRVRDAIRHADRRLISEARAVFTISETVSGRLRRYSEVDSTPLYPPVPDSERFYSAEAEDYLFFPSRLTSIKRQDLVLGAMAQTREPVRVRFAGAADFLPTAEALQDTARRLGLAGRVEWLGAIGEEEKCRQYAHALGVVFPPFDEDFGYVTLEAMLSAKPVLTCTDSGGPLELVRDRETGLVVVPTPASLAAAMDLLWQNRAQARAWGEAGRERYHSLDITWPNVVERLLACA
jgi:glycosyltransferase involved in cell wall biosynthesis